MRGKKTVPVNVSGQIMVNDVGLLLAACLGGVASKTDEARRRVV